MATESEIISSLNSLNIQSDDPVNVQFTSGTTGKPKAVLLSHFQLVNKGIFTGLGQELNTNAHIFCLQLPMFHVAGIVVAIMPALIYGATLVLPAKSFNAVASLQAISDEKYSI